MGRDREKYKLAIIVEGRDEYEQEAQQWFLDALEMAKKRKKSKVRTISKPKTGDRKFDKFIIILD